MTDPTLPAADAQPGPPIADYPAPDPADQVPGVGGPGSGDPGVGDLGVGAGAGPGGESGSGAGGEPGSDAAQGAQPYPGAPVYPAAGSTVPANPVPLQFRATATRQLTIPVAAAQPVLVRAALVAGFVLQDQLLTSIRGQRGSKYSGAALKPDKLPVSLAITLTDSPAGAQVELVLTDRWPGVFGRSPAVAAAFRPVLLGLIADIDSALAAADPRAEFAEPECTIPAGMTGAGPSALGRTIDRTNRALEATPGARGRATPTGSVMLVIPDAYAELDWTELQAMMTAGVLIATRRGPLPERLANEVARVVAALETAAPRAGAATGEVRIKLDAAARPVIDFLDLQAQLRGKLPLRTLHVCTTCRLEKIVNPDFQRLQAKNRKLRILTTTVGGAISMHGVSAFLLVGRLAHLKLLDPDFVCPRCQGMTAETSLITFCPKCGERDDAAALRTCRKCGHDLRTEVTITPLWTEGEPPTVAWPAPYAAVGGDPAAWPAPDPAAAVPAPDPGAAWSAPDPAPGYSVPVTDAAGPDLANWPAPDPAADTATWSAPDPAAAALAPDPGAAWPVPDPAADTATWPAPDPAAAVPEPDPSAAWPAPDPAADTATWPVPDPAAAVPEPAQAPVGPAIVDLPPPQPAARVGPPPGWHPDPHGRHQFRWWDGAMWSEHVSNQGVVTSDPVT